MTKLTTIEGIGETFAQKLMDAGIKTTEALLKKGATAEGRREMVEMTGIRKDLILDWVNRADLFRIKGIGEEYADLLEVAGVDTVPELAQRNPENLYEKMMSVNAEKELVRRMPTLNQVEAWVAQAKELPRVITY
jgi:predicted flap endonuclease-1-like 5' DNA nuclease